jgi:hypothetical protein
MITTSVNGDEMTDETAKGNDSIDWGDGEERRIHNCLIDRISTILL